MDFARTRLAADIGKNVQDREFSGIMNCLIKICRTDGIYGLYRGFGISLAGIIVYRASYFGMFDTGKALFFKNYKDSNFFLIWAFAQTVTVSAGIASYPLDTVRRRLMMQSGRSDILYKNTWDCFLKIY